jgi:hypothetical protein
VHGIGARKSAKGSLGFASANLDGGSFFVFFVGQIEKQWQRTAYHEILHFFGLNDVCLPDVLTRLSNALGGTPTPAELASILETEHEGRIYEFFVNKYPAYMNLQIYPMYMNPPLPGDPNQGIMDYITLGSGTWEAIQLKPHQIVQIQKIAKPSPYSKPAP